MSLGIGFPCQLSRSSISTEKEIKVSVKFKEHNSSENDIQHVKTTTLTFESFALECLGNDASGFALDLLSLPESFAQLLHIVSIHKVCVPPTQTWLNFNSISITLKQILTER